MNKALLTIIACFLLGVISYSQKISTRFEESNYTQTPTYFEIIDWWKALDTKSGKIKMLEMGDTDAGYPLHLITISNNGDYNFQNIRKNNKRIIFINNGIHPGEPDGIDASMLLVRDIAIGSYKIPDNIVLAIIPVYNIGGCLNRSANYRVDQNGPDEFGFRGNSQNLDLNRDFIKCDSKEARSFTQIFHLLDPDVFIDNHVSNGADYQHIITLLTTQHNKLGGVLGEYLNKQFEPAIYKSMQQKGYSLIPYVNVWNDLPENGWQQFWDSPRYGSGFAALWHTFSFIPETHMLKSYQQRVMATYSLMQSFIEFTSANSQSIKNLREQAKKETIAASQFPVTWVHDKTKFQEIPFKGFQSGYKPSDVSGLPRLFYDRSKPYEKTINFYNNYIESRFVNKPKAYIIPQGWWKVIDLLQLNKVQMQRLKKDTIISVEVYRIDDYKTAPRQYEMHHTNSDVKTTSSQQKIKFLRGDWYLPLNQIANRFLIETLEPYTEDSYFTWNFFDAILGQKEGYSAYVFEDKASEYLKNNTLLQENFNLKKNADTTFAKNPRAQLNYVYQNSPWFEPDYLRYPVYRVN